MADQTRTMNALRGLRRTAAQSRTKASGSDSPSLTIILGMESDEEHDPDAEDWDKVGDDAPTMPGSGPQERKRRRTGG